VVYNRVIHHAGKPLLTALVLAALTASLGFSQNPSDIAVSFDHVRPPDLLFLRIRNNSRDPIQVLATAPQTGAEGVELVHEIVESESPRHESGWISPPEHYSPVNEATTVEIPSHTDLLFSVPLNHVGPSWLLRISFQFANPKVPLRQQPQGAVDFTWADVPAKERVAWKK